MPIDQSLQSEESSCARACNAVNERSGRNYSHQEKAHHMASRLIIRASHHIAIDTENMIYSQEACIFSIYHHVDNHDHHLRLFQLSVERATHLSQRSLHLELDFSVISLTCEPTNGSRLHTHDWKDPTGKCMPSTSSPRHKRGGLRPVRPRCCYIQSLILFLSQPYRWKAN